MRRPHSDDLLAPRLAVIGSRDVATVDRLVQLFAPFGGKVVTTPDPAAAGLIKCAHNTFNPTKIGFWNEIASLACRLVVDPDLVAETMAFSAEGSSNPLHEIRGGAPFRDCLTKDLEGLMSVARESAVPSPLPGAVQAVNLALTGNEGA